MGCHHDRRDPHAKGGRGNVPLSDLRPDDTDRILLTIARHLFRDQTFPGRGAARLAVSVADLSFGFGRGTAIAAALQEAVQVMRRSRRDVFHYNNPDCPDCAGLLTGAELHFFQVLRAVRLGRGSAASAHAMLLCEGNNYLPLLEAVAQVFRRFSDDRRQGETETRLTD